jgi:catecholate siderophore receptor
MLATVLPALLLLGSPAPGAATVGGRVLDATRSPIPSAAVVAVAEDGGATASATTGADGRFTVALAPGRYTITASAAEFDTASQAVTARAGETPALEFVLKVAHFQDSVTVSAEPGYQVGAISTATRTLTPLRDVPQAVTVVTHELIKDQLMLSMADVVRYVPGIATHQGENNRDQVIIRGNNSSADFFVNGVRDDVQYYRDLYNLERVEALKGPNAMMFGRGGGGGVVNRVTKEASFERAEEVTLQAGSFGHKRVATDFNRPLGGAVAVRLNAMYEDSDSFRSGVGLERYGIAPALTIAAGARTRITLGYEHLHDTRVADRGMPSFHGLPAGLDPATFFGNPDDSHVRADVDLVSAMVEQRFGRATVRNRTVFGDYDRWYQNFVPGAVNAAGTQAALSAYNNATRRRNVFNQTDLTWTASTGAFKHTLLAGAELGAQSTDNFRNTGFFDGTLTTIQVALEQPVVTRPVTFRQSATDADNHVRTRVAAAYAQDQLALASWLQVVAGLRFDRFDLRYHNNRNGDTLDRVDDLVSPRAGLVVKPMQPLSLYTSYTVSCLPSSGDQFSSLTNVTQQVEPEKFVNLELGAKWDPRPDLSLAAAVYRLDRTNTRSTDPNDPARIVQTGSQRTSGFELGVNGRLTRALSVAGGYTFQDAKVTSATVSAREGAVVAQVPRHTLALWGHYRVARRLAVGVGVVRRTDMFAAIDDTVTLPGYTRLDAAAYYVLGSAVRLQANVENVLDESYFVNADNNNNISPGAPRSVRVAITTAF